MWRWKASAAGFEKADIYRLAASAEQLSEHPLGKAIVRCCKKTGAGLAPVEDFVMIPGRGVTRKGRGQGRPRG